MRVLMAWICLLRILNYPSAFFYIPGEFEAKHSGQKVHVYQGGESFGVSSILLKRPHS